MLANRCGYLKQNVMANKRQLKTIAKNIVARHLLLGGDFDYPMDLLSEKDCDNLRKEVDGIAYSIVKRVYKTDNTKTDVDSIVKDVLLNVK